MYSTNVVTVRKLASERSANDKKGENDEDYFKRRLR